jgi:uncharacterized membrane protein
MEIDILGIVLRWMHIFAAIALFGGTIFQRIALHPTVGELDAEQRALVADGVRRRWSKVVMVAILFLLVSGLVNYILTVKAFKALGAVNPDDNLPPLFHALWGIKFLLALVVFFFASVLSGRSEGTKRFRENAGKWLTVNLVLATIIVCISGVLRSTHTGPNVKPPANVTSDGQESQKAN